MEPDAFQLYNHLTKNFPGGNYYSVYEAGFSGYWIHKQLTQLGIKNIIVNAADIPTKHKERDRKSDKIDSRKLARELESRSIEGIYIPNDKALAIRSVSRNYIRIQKELIRIKLRIKSFLHFYGIEIINRDEISHWSGEFIHWLKGIKFSEEELNYSYQVLLEEYGRIRQERLISIRYMRRISKGNKIIRRLYSVPGIGFIISFVVYAEIIDASRFSNTDKMASYIGMVPSVEGSGEKEKVKGLTVRRNQYLRSLFIQAAWKNFKNRLILYDFTFYK